MCATGASAIMGAVVVDPGGAGGGGAGNNRGKGTEYGFGEFESELRDAFDGLGSDVSDGDVWMSEGSELVEPDAEDLYMAGCGSPSVETTDCFLEDDRDRDGPASVGDCATSRLTDPDCCCAAEQLFR